MELVDGLVGFVDADAPEGVFVIGEVAEIGALRSVVGEVGRAALEELLVVELLFLGGDVVFL